MARNGRDSPSCKLTIAEIVHHMANGWVLVCGRGFTNFGCWLRRDGHEALSVSRAQYVKMRDLRYIEIGGIDAPISLTERGKKRAAAVAKDYVLAGA